MKYILQSLLLAFGMTILLAYVFTDTRGIDISNYPGVDFMGGCRMLIINRHSVLAFGEPKVEGNKIIYPISNDSFGPDGLLLKIGFSPDYDYVATCRIRGNRVILERYFKIV